MERKTVMMPVEPPDDLVDIANRDKFRSDGGHFDEILFNLCRDDDYRGLYREFVKRYGKS